MSNVTLTETCMCGSRIDVVAGTVFTEHQAQLFREAHEICRDRLTACGCDACQLDAERFDPILNP